MEQTLTEREVVLERARATLQSGAVADAAAALAGLLAARPDDYEARVLLAGAKLLDGQAREALKHANLALALREDDAGVWVTKASALTALGEPVQAIAAAKRALAREPDNRGALTNLVTLYGATKNLEGQAEVLATLAGLDDTDLDVRLAQAQNQVALGNVPAAKALAEQVVRANPRHARAQLLLGAIAYDRSAYDEALDHARFALAVEETDAAQRLLEASFYVVVASRLQCEAGARPWPEAGIIHVLKGMEERNLDGVASFVALDASLAGDAGVAERVRRAAATRCPDRLGGWVACAAGGSAVPDAEARKPWSPPPASVAGCLGIMGGWSDKPLVLTRSARGSAVWVRRPWEPVPKVQNTCFRDDVAFNRRGCKDSRRFARSALRPCGPLVDRGRLGTAADDTSVRAYGTSHPQMVVVEADDADGVPRVTAVLRCHAQTPGAAGAPNR